jgi:hypothetical protein
MNEQDNKGMEYNSSRELLIIPEYGRNVQKLINHAKTIEDKAFRQAFVERVVELMQQMNPQSGNIDDYKTRLWKHVFRIADFDLDVDSPLSEQPTEEEKNRRPEAVPYPVMEAKYRHYGHNVQQLVKKALSMPEGPKRDGFAASIAAYMKLAYKTWNKEHYVSDEVIKADLENLSNGDLKIDRDQEIEFLANPSRSNNNNNKRKQRSNSGKRNSGRSYRRRK